MRPLATALIGGLAGLTLVGGTLVSGLNARPGAALRQVQSLQIDATLGAPDVLQGPAGPLYTWRHGPTTGGTAVLVHGFGDAGAGWTQVALTLGKTHRVVVLDLPGHGRSAPYGDHLDMAMLEAGLEQVLDGVDGEVVLVGNSLGGWLSARYALDHPDRVQHLVLVNAAGLSQEVDRDLLLPTTRLGQAAKNRAILGEQAARVPGPVVRGLLQLNRDPRLYDLFEELDTEPPVVDDRLPTWDGPTTLVWGTPDPFFPVSGYLGRMQQALPQARTITLDGCGHAPQYTCDADVAGAILGALDTP